MSVLAPNRYYVHGDVVICKGYTYDKRDAFVKMFNNTVYQLANRTIESGVTDSFWKTKYIPIEAARSLKGKEFFDTFFPNPDEK